MDYNQWNNHTAIGYLKYALERYQEVAINRASGKWERDEEEEIRVLTDAEISKIIGCMHYAFDMKTLEEAYDHS